MSLQSLFAAFSVFLHSPQFRDLACHAVLNARGVGFSMRVEKAGITGFACVRDFLRADEDDRIVTLPAPCRHRTGATPTITIVRRRRKRCG